MLLSLEQLLQLNLPYDVFPFVLVFYWIICGAIVQSFFMKLDKYLPVGNYSHTVETAMTRRLLYFICGGAILPMLIFLLPPIFFTVYLAKYLEEKVNRKQV